MTSAARVLYRGVLWAMSWSVFPAATVAQTQPGEPRSIVTRELPAEVRRKVEGLQYGLDASTTKRGQSVHGLLGPSYACADCGLSGVLDIGLAEHALESRGTTEWKGRLDKMVGGGNDTGIVMLPGLDLAAAALWRRWSGELRGSVRDAAVKLVYGSSDKAGVCSGVLVSQRWVLSAAHCVKRMPVAVRVGVMAYPSRDYVLSKRCVAFSEVSCQQAALNSETNPQADLVLLELRSEIPASIASSVAVADVPEGEDITNEFVRLVGYGLVLESGSQRLKFPLVRQQALAWIKNLVPRPLGHPQPGLFLVRSASRTYLTSGDSGGPVLMRSETSADEVLVGIAVETDEIRKEAYVVKLWRSGVRRWLAGHVPSIRWSKRLVQKRPDSE